jgi:hypothetical protein
MDWQNDLKLENDEKLFDIFSDTDRINIEPQIYAGNLLFERGYDLIKLSSAKKRLIDSIELCFQRKYTLDPIKNRKENIIRELVLKSIIAAILLFIASFTPEFEYNIGNIIINNKLVAYFIVVSTFVPLLWIKKSNQASMRKAVQEQEIKDLKINKINTELRF